MPLPLRQIALIALAAVLAPPPVMRGQDAAEAAEGGAAPAEGPVALLEQGREAYQKSDFAAAAAAFEKFIKDYGENPETQEAVRIHTPLLAISLVGDKKYQEALEWIEKSFADPKLDRLLADELSFWKGICLMTLGQLVEAQHAFGAYWANESHQPFKRYEALLLFANLYLQQGFPEAAADFLGEEIPKFQDIAPEAASRAVVLELFALLQAEKADRALALIREQYPRLDEMTQPISFETLALQLGSRFLEEKRWHDAIACLQRIWPREQLLRYQNEKKRQVEERIAELQKAGNRQSVVFQLRGILKRVNRELENFHKIENFDSALRLRLALAFQGLGRYREAALVMEEMLKSLPPDPVVDSASLALIQCWMQIRRWPKAREAADLYLEKFADAGKNLPMAMFLRAEALREDLEFAGAQLAYGDLVERFPDDPLAPKCTFMQGFLYLQQDDNEGAAYQFEQVKRRYPDSGLIDDAEYWSGMALSFSKEYEAAREQMKAYLKTFGEGKRTPKYRKEAVFRIAVCTFSLAEYPESIGLLGKFIEEHPGDELLDEARLLLGDALLGEGEIERGVEVYRRIRPEATRFFEDAWFKIGKAWKLTEEFDKMRAHYEKFVAEYPRSRRMPEAVYWIGWVDSQAGDVEKAREIYWKTLEEYGDDPSLFSMADLVTGLPKVYEQDGEEGRQALLARLEQLKFRAETQEKKTLALRCGWGRARLLMKNGTGAGEAAMQVLGGLVDPKVHNPLISVDCADALRRGGNELQAEKLYRETRRWHPRAIQKDRIYAGLGAIHESRGEIAEAIQYYERFEKETAASSGLSEIRLRRADLLAGSGKGREARAVLEEVVTEKTAGAADKAKAILALGEQWMSENEPLKASAYFERVYVSYGKFRDLVARSYLRRGEALEKIDHDAEALEVYRELASREDLKEFEETKQAREKVKKLEPLAPAPVEQPRPEAGKEETS